MMQRRHVLTLIAALMPLASPALASDYNTSAPLKLELNAADNFGESCRLSFLLKNETATDIDSFVAETVLFNDQNQVALLTLFDFGLLPKGRARVRQFQVPDMSCDSLGLVLINGADTCTGDGHDARSCAKALELNSRVDIKLEG